MNIENIKKGMVIKNYKELCKLINIKPTTGEAKQNQLNKLAELVEYHKEGNKIIIDNIKKLSLEESKTSSKKLLTNNINNNIIIQKNYDIFIDKTTTLENKEEYWNLLALANQIIIDPYIKDYKTLCSILEIPYNRNNKDKVLDHLNLFFNFQRNINKKGLKGNGYMFKEIISLDFEPLERQTKYYDGIRDIMLVQWQQHENMKSGNIYKKDIFTMIDLCNPEYFEYKQNNKSLENEGIDNLTIEDFFTQTDRKLTNIMTNSFQRMFKQGLLSEFSRSYNIVEYDEDEKAEVYRPCTTDERDYIQFCIHRALNEFENPIVDTKEIIIKPNRGFSNKIKTKTIEIRKYKRYSVNDIYPNRLNSFTNFVIKLIQEKYPNILRYYSCYQIRFNEYSCNYYIERHDIDSEGKDTNEKVVNELLRMFRKNQEKALNDNVPETYKKFKEVRKNIIPYERLIDLTIMTKK